MRTVIVLSLLLAALALPASADPQDRFTGTVSDLLDSDLTLLREDLRSITQYPPGTMPSAPARPRRLLFPGPNFISVDFGVSFVPIVGGTAADDSSPHLAVYREYWTAGAGLHADVHFKVLPTADAYIGISAIHHSSSGKQDWHTTQGTDSVWIRYRFDPLYIFPLEVGGKGYLPLSVTRALRFLDPHRQAPMLYLRIGAGPALVKSINIDYKRYVNGALHSTLDEVWWETQSVLNVHLAVGFEWGGFRTKKGRSFGLYGELGYRYIGAPVVTHFGDYSDALHTITLTVGMHIP